MTRFFKLLILIKKKKRKNCLKVNNYHKQVQSVTVLFRTGMFINNFNIRVVIVRAVSSILKPGSGRAYSPSSLASLVSYSFV